MKKIILSGLVVLLITAVSCKETKKEVVNEGVNSEEASKIVVLKKFNLVPDATKVSFVAYKTTAKKPVNGVFKKINITKASKGDSPLEAMNGTEFSIPVSSVFTNDAGGTRDPKIVKFFFGVMENTELISGIFKVSEDQKCSIDITLNGKTNTIPLAHKMTGDNKFTFNGVMNLKNWDALGAVASINKACEILHTGEDGISKTWSEVAVKAEVLLQKN